MTNEEESRSPSPGLRSVTLHRNRVLEGVRREEAGLLAAQSTWMLEPCPPSHLFKIPALGLIPPFVLPKASTKIFFFFCNPELQIS